MTVDPARAAGSVEHHGTTYYFCSKGCVAKFTADPDRYLSGHRETMPVSAPAQLLTIGGMKRSSAAVAQHSPSLQTSSPSFGAAGPAPGTRPRTQYTCPMHPEVVSD